MAVRSLKHRNDSLVPFPLPFSNREIYMVGILFPLSATGRTGVEGDISESLCSGSAAVPGRPPLWEIKELGYSGVWMEGPAFEGRAGTTTSSRWEHSFWHS